MANQTIFVATPLHDSKVSYVYMAGALQAMSAFRDRIRIDVKIGSFLPRNRDVLTAMFLESGCTHMACIDSDIAWKPSHIQTLLDANKWFVSGIYPKKQPDRALPLKTNGKRDGDLYGVHFAPGGLLLLSRQCVAAMTDHYRALAYKSDHGTAVGLWSMLPGDAASEDVAFCTRWTAMGGDIWVHPGVVVGHAGEYLFEAHKDGDGCAVMPDDVR